ncbi:hypothetical protein O0544_10930 [Edwardsiella anguillarum]|nr:hypothetical protein [Edwardsiella anguillarum]
MRFIAINNTNGILAIGVITAAIQSAIASPVDFSDGNHHKIMGENLNNNGSAYISTVTVGNKSSLEITNSSITAAAIASSGILTTSGGRTDVTSSHLLSSGVEVLLSSQKRAVVQLFLNQWLNPITRAMVGYLAQVKAQ